MNVSPRSALGSRRPQAQALPARTAWAVALGNLVARLSRLTGCGRGGIIGGRVSLALQPAALADLCRGKVVVLVTGTNGKTTTTCLLARAMVLSGDVACNDTGANMPDGLVAALAAHSTARYTVLEIDENHLPAVLADVTPAMVLLLNLSRDQLDRIGEVRRTEYTLRAVLAQCSSTVVANCDDILVASAALDAAFPVWVSPGAATALPVRGVVPPRATLPAAGRAVAGSAARNPIGR